ncbi:ABC transporter permease [Anaerolineales bacterium]
MLHHIGTIFRYDFLRFFKRKGYLFMTFGLPLIAFALFFGYQFILANPAEEGPSALEQDNPMSPSAIQSAAYVDHTGKLNSIPDKLKSILQVYDSEAEAQAALEAGDISVYYVFAEDYFDTSDVKAYIPAVTLGTIGSSIPNQIVLEFLQSELPEDLSERLADPINYKMHRLDGEIAVTDEQLPNPIASVPGVNYDSQSIALYLFSLMFLLAIFATNGYLMQGIVEEKESNLIEIFLTSLGPTQIFAGKVLAMGALGLLQVFTWFASLLFLIERARTAEMDIFLSQLQIKPEMILLMLLYFIFGYLLFSAVFASIGSLVESVQQGSQYTAFVILPAMAPYMFAFLFSETPNEGLPLFLSLFPLTSPIAMVMRLSITTVPAPQILISLVLLILTVILMLWITGKIFRIQIMLTGNSPSLKNIWTLVRNI